GYSIRPSQRGQGYGKLLLGYLMEQAKALGIDRLLLTIHNDNEASRRTAIACGGVEEDHNAERRYIWIDCSK
ncbi:MAG: GNAT family N-acetyltransferase, partial [Clostridiales bacterium]|nr:GNAT family N-acetyltransferase [Clostridiales bacterium]